MAEIAESIDSTRDVATVRWFHAPSGTFDYTFTLGWADTNRDTYYGGGMDPNAYGTTENPLLTADLQFNHRLGDHFLTLGLQHSRDKLTDTQPAYDRFVEDTYSNTGLYIQDDWFFAKGWELVIGARVDDFSELDDPIVSPRGALRYAPRPDLTFRAAVATGFRGPQVFDEDLHITIVGGEGQVIRNASDLEEESSFSTTLGVEWTPVTDMGVGLVEFNLFQTDIDDLFLVIEDDDPLTDDQEFTRINFGEAAVKGFRNQHRMVVQRRVHARTRLCQPVVHLRRARSRFRFREFRPHARPVRRDLRHVDSRRDMVDLGRWSLHR
jgi:outer membrane receptor for ferrienterochelin and colicin